LIPHGRPARSPRPGRSVVVSRREVAAVRKIVSQADPQAFMVINPSHEVLGEGFKPLLHPRPPYRARPR